MRNLIEVCWGWDQQQFLETQITVLSDFLIVALYEGHAYILGISSVQSGFWCHKMILFYRQARRSKKELHSKGSFFKASPIGAEVEILL